MIKYGKITINRTLLSHENEHFRSVYLFTCWQWQKDIVMSIIVEENVTTVRELKLDDVIIQ